MKALATALVAACVALPAASVSISWTGYAGNNQWATHNNWYPNQVPGPNDDVTIPKGTVQLTVATGVNSLTMGTEFSEAAHLTIFKAFYIGSGGLTVAGNGNLVVNTGLDQITGQVNVAGNLKFVDGIISGQWTTNTHGVADFTAPGEKALVGCQLTTNGPLKLGGLLELKQSSVVQANGVTTSTGSMIQAGDKTAVLFDATKGSFTFSTGVLSLQAPALFGSFALQSGNVSLFSTVTFNSALAIPAGSYVDGLGDAAINLQAGATGAGVATFMNAKTSIDGLKMTGDVNVGGRSVDFHGTASSVGVLTILGGLTDLLVGVSCKQANLLSGTVHGNALSAEQVYVKTTGFIVNTAIKASKAVTFAESTLTFGANGAFIVLDSAIAQTMGPLHLLGPLNTPGFVNNGALTVTASMSTQNVHIAGTGTIAATGKLSVNNAGVEQKKITLASGAVFSGVTSSLNVAAVAAKTVVKGVIGQYKFECPQQCDKISAQSVQQEFSFTA